MNSKTRRKFSSEFKAKVAMEALQERSTIEELSKKYDLHPNQILQWKKTLKEGGSKAFEGNGGKRDKAQEELIAELYRQIGALKVDNEFLKKSCYNPLRNTQADDRAGE